MPHSLQEGDVNGYDRTSRRSGYREDCIGGYGCGNPERLETVMPFLFRMPRPRVFMSSILLAVFVQVLSISARAEVQVTGAPDAIKVDAKETSVEELLTALRKAYGLQYWSSAKS